ncbi:isoamylase [Leadbettera azotonutricia]|nr:isoamylase [Leadbettera azotonutricia]
MKSIMATALLILTIGIIGAADLESYQFIDRLLTLPGPGAPVIFEDTVIFTAPSSYRRVGISFAFEGYSRVYWYKKLMIPEDPAVIAAMGKKKNINPNKDSGILFHVQTIPEDIGNLDYRMVIEGLWTPDPLNPLAVRDEAGLTQSRVAIPVRAKPPSTFDAPAGSLRFTYNSAPGETITVGGTFNGWDPFMYELRETSPGVYTLTLALPPGTYQYVFFHRGERLLDPHNPNKIYTKQGMTASVAKIP